MDNHDEQSTTSSMAQEESDQFTDLLRQQQQQQQQQDDKDEQVNDEEEDQEEEEEDDDEEQQEEEESVQTTTSALSMQQRQQQQQQMVKGTLAQNLMEKIVRNKIIANTYYKAHCFGLNAETIIDKAIDLDYIGGTYGGNRRPTPFLCLLFKLLQIQPEREIVLAYITNKNHKYVTVLGAVYLRLTGKAVDVYTYLELLYNDYRKIVRRKANGKYEIVHMDEIADELLNSSYAYDINLPYLPKRRVLEDNGQLDKRVSILEEQEEEEEQQEQISPSSQASQKEHYSEKKETKYSYDHKSSSGVISLSIEATNRLRAQIGLRPLKL